MRYISLFIGGILAFASCSEVKVSGNSEETGVLTAGFQDTVVTVFENVGTGSLNVNFSQTLVRDTRMAFAVVQEENVQEGKDYFLSSKEVMVAAGGKSAKVDYSLVDDMIANDLRSFTLKLRSVNGGVVEAGNSEVRVKILDDESDVAVGFGETEVTVKERETGSTASSFLYRIPVELFGTLSKPLQFKVMVSPLDSPDAAVENVNFSLPETTIVVEDATAGVTIPVEIIDDDAVNTDRIFALDITEVVGAELYTAQRRCIVTIQNDDQGVYFENAKMEAEERAGVVKVPVKVTNAGDRDMSFVLSCSGTAKEGEDYTLTKEYTIRAGETNVDVEVELKHVAGITPDRTLTLGFASVSSGLAVFEKQSTFDLKILDVDTEVGFSRDVLGVAATANRMQIPVTLAAALEHDVVLKVKVAALQGLQPEEVTISEPLVTIPKGKTEANVEIALKPSLVKGRLYFDVDIAEIYGASTTSSVRIDKYFAYKGADLAIASYSSQEDGGGEAAPSGYAAAAIDGNEATYWHTNWTGGGSGSKGSLPEGIVVELPDNFHLWKIELVRRVAKSNSDDKKALFYVSNTLTDWKSSGWGNSLGTVTWEKCATEEREEHAVELLLPSAVPAGYLKIDITESHRNTNAQIAEVIVHGYTE